mmetsp:Transcript_25216/g.75922  ORF Transcript_25216/g.75922 Transcript_25216/m.75922 type:complete len:285 (-) Transcript_25216:1120-1974(-)
MALVPYSRPTHTVCGTQLQLWLPGLGTEGLRHTGRILWPGCVDMIETVLVPRRGEIAGRRVLELGAGAAGLPGLAAAVLAARSVLLSDVPDNVPSLQKNAAENEKVLVGTVTACAFEWRDDGVGGSETSPAVDGAAAAAAAMGPPVGQLIPDEVVAFAPEIVLCADCVFEGTERVLAATLAAILSAVPSAEIWMVNIVIRVLRRFKRELRCRGLSVHPLSAAGGRVSKSGTEVVRWRVTAEVVGDELHAHDAPSAEGCGSSGCDKRRPERGRSGLLEVCHSWQQ